MKSRFTVFCALACAVLLASCAKAPKQSTPASNKLKVSVTFNALKEMAQAVGGDYVEISTIIPDGMEPHDFEPKAQDMAALSTAAVFVYNGLDLEHWADEAVAAAKNGALVVVNASAGAEPLKLEGEEGAEMGGTDPHLWLSVKGGELESRNIAKAFAKADPAHADDYAKNAEAFAGELESLFTEYAAKIADAPRKEIVTGHAAFGYLCRDFGIEQNSVEDVFASGEPTPQQLAKLIEFSRAKGVKTIFVEEMVSPAVSQTLAKEVGADVATIYTMESAEDDKTYLERMKSNLEEITKSLTE